MLNLHGISMNNKNDKLFKGKEPLYQFDESVFRLIDKDWMLICAGSRNHYNMMTASWGTMGILWNKPIAIIFIRPQRYTFDFVEKNEYFTLNFFEETYRDTLKLMGTKSGREINKMQHNKLQVKETGNETPFFEQARYVMECKKIYSDDIKPELFMSADIEKMYPEKDYHRWYIGEIIQGIIKD